MARYDDNLDLYDGEELYMDEFGERIDNDPAMEEDFEDSPLIQEDAEDDLAASRTQGDHEAAFRETIGQTDQVGDENLQDEAEQDYTEEDTARDEAA
jgi:hypothetical protein